MKEIVLGENYDIICDQSKLVNKYLEYIDVSKTTYDTYKNGLKMFFAYLKENNIDKPLREDVIAFREELKKGHSISTVNTYLISIRNFFKWLEYEEIYKDITKNIKGLAQSKEHKREPFSDEQMELILKNTKNSKEKLIILLGLCCGLRANEICNIRLSDFKEKSGKILLYVLGKARDGGKVDYVVVERNLYDFIVNYVKEYDIKDYLITSDYKKDGSKVTNKTIRYVVKQVYKRAGIDEFGVSCHTLRHTFATDSILSGADIREVSKALRHASCTTTEVYLHDIEQRNNPCFGNVASKFSRSIN